MGDAHGFDKGEAPDAVARARALVAVARAAVDADPTNLRAVHELDAAEADLDALERGDTLHGS